MPLSGEDHHKVERVFSAILGPISKVLIKNNLTLRSTVELLKRALVEAALEDGDATDSLVSLKTGVHRKDVKRLRADLDSGTAGKNPISGLAAVLSVWSNDPRFSDRNGKRLILDRKGSGGTPGFDDLIKVSKVDLAPSTVLTALEEQHLVVVHSDGGIELLSATFVAQSGEAALDAFEATVADHVRVAAQNVLSPPGAPRHFDQVLRYSHLSEASVETLEAEARKMAHDYLVTLNALAHRLQSEDDASGALANGRFVTGAFVAPRYPSDASPAAQKKTVSEKDKEE